MFLEGPPIFEKLEDVQLWCHQLWLKLQEERYIGSATWDPGNVADGEMVTTNVTVTGAALGDFAIASFSLDVQDLVLDAQVTAANVVSVTLTNDGINAGVDLAEGTVYVRVFKRTT